MNYNFVVIEGNIGAGKTSLASKIANDVNAKLILERFADNPFLPKFYENPERFSFPLELSFLAERYNQLKNEIASRDLFKTFTIADYFFMKSLIFSKSTLSNDEYVLYRQIFNIIYNFLPKPNLLVYLHQDIDQLLKNIKKRGRSYEQAITKDYLIKIQEGYFEYFKQQLDLKILIIDVTNIDFINSEQDYCTIKDTIFNKKIELGITRAFL